MSIRAANPTDFEFMHDLWLRSVRATHAFLSEEQIVSLLPAVREYLSPATPNLWVFCDDLSRPVGFMGLTQDKVDSLFVAPERLRTGVGRALLEHARTLEGRLRVDVNEQNPEAIKFYEASGFRVVGRSALDDAGRPYPLLHMREAMQ